MNRIAWASVFVSLFVCGCGGGIPSEADAKAVYMNGLPANGLPSGRSFSEVEGLAKLINFEKVNGRMGSNRGTDMYVLEAVATFECLKDVGGEKSYFGGESEIICRKGEHIKDATTIRFLRTEKGWKGEDGNIY